MLTICIAISIKTSSVTLPEKKYFNSDFFLIRIVLISGFFYIMYDSEDILIVINLKNYYFKTMTTFKIKNKVLHSFDKVSYG